MGYVSIFLGFALVVWLIVKRWPAIIVGIIASTAIIVLNGLPFGETMDSVYFQGFVTMMKSIFPCLFAGSLLSQVFSLTGAVNSIGDAMSNALFRDGLSDTRRYVSCILAVVLTSGVLAFCGMNSVVAIVALYPIALRLMERAGIPKRFVMGMLSAGVYSFALSGPGSAQLVNILGMQEMGTTSYAGLTIGIVTMLVEITVTTTLLTMMIRRDVARGKVFAYGPKDLVAVESAGRPGALISILPLLVLVALFNIISLDIFTSTMFAWLLGVVLFWKYIPQKDGSRLRTLLGSCSEAGIQAFNPVGMVGSLVGFSSIVQSLPEFDSMINAVFSLSISPVIVLLISISFIAALTGSSTSAIKIGMPIVAGRCQEIGLTAAYVHRVSAFACTIFDSLPYSSAIIINLGIADLDMKGGYPPMFVATCVSTFCGTVTCGILMCLFPFLP